MRKQIIVYLLSTIILSALLTMHIVFHNSKNVFVNLNVEALTDTESLTLPLNCSTTSPIIICSTFCRSCSTLWTVPGISGQYIEGSSKCLCGAVL